jgi:hypothetical protein
MSRMKEQAEILFRLGQLIGPMLSIVEHPDNYDQDERTRILARYFAEADGFEERVAGFAKSEPGHDYWTAYGRVRNAMNSFSGAVVTGKPDDDKKLFFSVGELHRQLFSAVQSVPVSVQSAIHEAQSPFSTYCLVKDLCSTAKSQVMWMDRYFDQSLFHRYFTDLPKATTITLVTWPESKCNSQRDRDRYKGFVDVSRLFAQEHGPAAYRLLTSEDFHDRWLRCDDKLFILGGSIKDLGKDTTFTVSKLDTTPENFRLFDEAVNSGTEVFGPSQPNHP